MRMHIRIPLVLAGCQLLMLVGCQTPTDATPLTGAAPLTEAQILTEAREIHSRVLTLDTHKDIDGSAMLATSPGSRTGEELDQYRRKFDPTVRGDRQVDFPKMREGGYDCAFYIVFVGQGKLTPAGYHRAHKTATQKFKAIHRMADRFPEHIGLALRADDVQRIHDDGRLVACIGIENGFPMGLDIARIADFHKRGARYMGIAHTGHTQLGDAHTPAEPMHGGLSPLGRQAVAEMNRVGIIVDVSHSAKSTMMQVVKLSKAPVFASHSACRAICDHTRNLDDEQLRALRDKGGVIQIVALGDFVKDASARDAQLDTLAKEAGFGGRRALRRASFRGELTSAHSDRYREIQAAHEKGDVQDFVDHIDHAVQVIGIDHVAISSDFDGGGGVVGWNNAAETFNVTLELVRRGYTEAQIGKLWSGNTLRLWRAVERVAAQSE